MTKYFFIILLQLFVFSSVAQTYRIDTTDISFENKKRPCLRVFYDADAKTVKKDWDDFMKKNYHIKIKGIGLFTDKDIISAEDVMLASVSDKRMNLYAQVVDVAGGSEMKYFMSFGYDFFIGPDNYPESFSGMKKILNDFSVKFLNDYYSDRIKSITKEVKKLERSKKSKMSAISKNNRKAKRESSTVASALDAKNQSLELEINEIERKIDQYGREIEIIKEKQKGITRN